MVKLLKKIKFNREKIYDNVVFSFKKAAKVVLGLKEPPKGTKYWWNYGKIISEMVQHKTWRKLSGVERKKR